MKRPILVAVIGYIIGIIWGLYFKFSIALLYILLILVIAIKTIIFKFLIINKTKRKFKIFYIPRYFRYVKLFLNKNVLIIICLFSLLSNTIVLIKNDKFNNLYNGVENAEFIAVVKELKSENNYNNIYKIKVLEINGERKFKDTNLYLKINKTQKASYGSIVKFKGVFKEPSISRNYKGFNYKEYLKQLDIYGTVETKNISVIKKEGVTKLEKEINSFRDKLKKGLFKHLDKEISGLYLGIILGDNSYIEEEITEQFRNSNMAHILAVSGMHVSYIVLGVSFALGNIIGKKRARILTIVILFFYLFITGFSPSIFRAVVMAVMVLLGSLIHRNNDVWTSIAFSLLIILICNPFLLTSISLQFSYLGTIGIMIFSKTFLKLLNKGEKNKSKIKEIIAVSVSAQIFIFPLVLYYYNTFGIYFLITNIIVSFIIRAYYIFLFYIFSSYKY